jgi:hypothetical protein
MSVLEKGAHLHSSTSIIRIRLGARCDLRGRLTSKLKN